MVTVNNRFMKKIINIAATGVLVFSSSYLFAPPPPPPPPDTSGPIDNFAIALLIIVAGYGYMRLKKQEKAVS